ncbi:prepilin-type N-terminal cleavage/methylation domain-containing protein [Candidatus Saccharibacteria bacterium CPR2]|nr:prepilin-type N-terminal cleavage/methylation domain-containing protein [Candidatus Saccharibacteria bacterium CPR2]
MNIKKFIKQQSGFTIIELLLAMAVFSFVLMITVAGFIQVNRSYTKGITVRRAQDSARTIVEQLSREIRISKKVAYDSASRKLCIDGGILYEWSLVNPGVTITGTPGTRLVRSEGLSSDCNTGPATNQTELMVPNTYLNSFNVDVSLPGDNLYNISLTIVVESDNNLINGNFMNNCSTNPADSAFCYFVSYSTSVNSF